METLPFEGLIQEKLDEVREARKIFEKEYDGQSAFKDLRWFTHMEGLFVDQLEKLTREVTAGGMAAETIGEYVMAFFIAKDDDGEFDL